MSSCRGTWNGDSSLLLCSRTFEPCKSSSRVVLREGLGVFPATLFLGVTFEAALAKRVVGEDALVFAGINCYRWWSWSRGVYVGAVPPSGGASAQRVQINSNGVSWGWLTVLLGTTTASGTQVQHGGRARHDPFRGPTRTYNYRSQDPWVFVAHTWYLCRHPSRNVQYQPSVSRYFEAW
jgi:hypothetical protein